MRHFLKETDFSRAEMAAIFKSAAALKKGRASKRVPKPLSEQSWGLIFFKKSTRTRVSFQVGVWELGGHPLVLNADDLQLTRGETEADTARVLSRFLHGVVIRSFGHETLETFVKEGSVPVVNALSDFLHPCQSYTDLFTMAERWAKKGGDLMGSLKGKTLAFFGDTACNMANSLALAGAYAGMKVVLCGPKGFEPTKKFTDLLKSYKLEKQVRFTTDPADAAKGADVLYTDVWVSMGMEGDEKRRIKQMRPYTVTKKLLDIAGKNALFMHCLPAHAGLEVTQQVLDDKRSIVYDQAENRLHTQKAILSALAACNKKAKRK